MGNLFFINDTFEFNQTPIANRDIRFVNFCKAMNNAKINKDELYATEDIFTIQLSYGNIFSDLFYKSWSEINNNPNLRGISNTAHSLFQSLLFAVPSMVKSVNTHQDFLELFQGSHFGNTGFQLDQNIHIPFICCEHTWHLWKCDWLSKNQSLIVWDNVENPFLPNKKYSDQLLMEEIIAHGKEHELIVNHKNNVGLAFHEEVMRPKGPEIQAYTIEIGKKIAEANYYRYEEDLSKNEHAKSGSVRNIYSVISKEGTLQYISLDHAHGMFEFHNNTGQHQGEFKFDGSFNSKAEDDHSFKTI